MSTIYPRKDFDIDKVLESSDDDISDARIWLNEHPAYTIRFDINNKWGGVTVQGVHKETKEILTWSTGQRLGKHVRKILRRLQRHASTGNTWNPDEELSD